MLGRLIGREDVGCSIGGVDVTEHVDKRYRLQVPLQRPRQRHPLTLKAHFLIPGDQRIVFEPTDVEIAE